MEQQYNELFAALAKAQAEFEVAGANRDAHYGGYADLEELIHCTRPALSKHGLCITRRNMVIDGKLHLVAILGHSSGQYIESIVPVNPDKSGTQGLGGCLSYLARYTYRDLTAVAIIKDPEDNDAGAESRSNGYTPKPVNTVVKSPEPVSTPKSPVHITDEQHEMLQNELKDSPDIAKMILGALKIATFKEMPKDVFLATIKRIREIK